MLNANDIVSGIAEYKCYIKRLNFLSFNPFLVKKCTDEKKKAKTAFVEKMKSIAKKAFDEKNYADAQKSYQAIFEADSKNIENIKNYITCLEKLEQYDIQLELSKHLLKLSKASENYKILSNAYNKTGLYREALRNYKKYLELSNKAKPDAGDYNLIGCYYFNEYNKGKQIPSDAKNALANFEKAVELAPKNKAYLKNSIFAAMKVKNYETEKKYWDVYFSENFANEEDKFTYSASCMRNGDIKTWAKYYEARFTRNNAAPQPKIDKPFYTGKEDLSGKTLLIHSEQGYGDNFLMFGYMPRLTKLAKKVIYHIQNGAYELIKNNDFGVEACCQKTIDVTKVKCDYHIPCMSIPIALGLDKDTLSVGSGYIKPNKELVEKYKNEYFNTKKFKIAIAYKGVASNAKRDIPIESLALLDKLKNVQLYCFTKDIDDKELKAFKKNNVINIAKEFEDFAHTAAALENVDLVISSDNCILNLAGAIGKNTLGIFNYHHEFRWYDLSGEDCGWFDCVKPIVNDEYNDWDKSILNAIKKVELIQKNGQ